MNKPNDHEFNKIEYVRTTVYLPRKLHTEAKIKAALAQTSVNNIVRIALQRVLKEMVGK
jgi:predicted HicB family RNase H-like nuclease